MTADLHDERWFTSIYTAYYPDVVRYARRRLADVDASAELAQEVFEVAWRRRVEVPVNSRPWLYGVARRLLANRWRDRRTHPPMHSLATAAPIHATGEVEPDSVAAIADLRAALDQLRETDREILCLIGWEELSIAEAAAVLGCTHTAAKVRLHRARRRLAAALAAPVPTTLPQATATR